MQSCEYCWLQRPITHHHYASNVTQTDSVRARERGDRQASWGPRYGWPRSLFTASGHMHQENPFAIMFCDAAGRDVAIGQHQRLGR